jgi:hypothetical protein
MQPDELVLSGAACEEGLYQQRIGLHRLCPRDHFGPFERVPFAVSPQSAFPGGQHIFAPVNVGVCHREHKTITERIGTQRCHIRPTGRRPDTAQGVLLGWRQCWSVGSGLIDPRHALIAGLRREGLSIRAIARRVDLSRSRVPSYLPLSWTPGSCVGSG